MDTEVEIGAGGAFDADDCGDVALAVVAVVQAPSGAICWNHDERVNIDKTSRSSRGCSTGLLRPIIFERRGDDPAPVADIEAARLTDW